MAHSLSLVSRLRALDTRPTDKTTNRANAPSFVKTVPKLRTHQRTWDHQLAFRSSSLLHRAFSNSSGTWPWFYILFVLPSPNLHVD